MFLLLDWSHKSSLQYSHSCWGETDVSIPFATDLTASKTLTIPSRIESGGDDSIFYDENRYVKKSVLFFCMKPPQSNCKPNER